jgi:hypothetical protein
MKCASGTCRPPATLRRDVIPFCEVIHTEIQTLPLGTAVHGPLWRGPVMKLILAFFFTLSSVLVANSVVARDWKETLPDRKAQCGAVSLLCYQI